MNFIQDIQLNGYPLNAFNDNIIEFEEVGAVRCTLTISALNNQVFEIAGIEGRFFFNFKEIFKAIINKDLFADDFDYSAILLDSNLYAQTNVQISTYDSDDVELATVNKAYSFFMSVSQIEHEPDKRKPLHLNHNDRYVIDVFKGYPVDFTHYHVGGSISIHVDNNPITYPSQDEGVWRFPIQDQNGINSFGFSLPLGEYPIEIVDDDGQLLLCLISHDDCDGVYLKWLNVFGGWDYWLFSSKHLVEINERSQGAVYSGYDNPYNLNSVESELGKNVAITHSLTADFLTARQFKKVLGLAVTPKCYLWTGSKFIEVSVTNKTSYIYNKPEGRAEFDITLPKRFTQTA